MLDDTSALGCNELDISHSRIHEPKPAFCAEQSWGRAISATGNLRGELQSNPFCPRHRIVFIQLSLASWVIFAFKAAVIYAQGTAHQDAPGLGPALGTTQAPAFPTAKQKL